MVSSFFQLRLCRGQILPLNITYERRASSHRDLNSTAVHWLSKFFSRHSKESVITSHSSEERLQNQNELNYEVGSTQQEDAKFKHVICE